MASKSGGKADDAVRPGLRFIDSRGRINQVTRTLPGGRVEIRSAAPGAPYWGRVGEWQTNTMKALLADGALQRLPSQPLDAPPWPSGAAKPVVLPNVPRRPGPLGLGVVPNLGLVDRAKQVVTYKMTCGVCLEEVDTNEHQQKTGHDFFFNSKAFSTQREDDEYYDGPRRYRD